MEKKIMVSSLIMMILVIKSTVDAITCEAALTRLMPGQLFLTSEAFVPISPCCLAVANINAGSTTTSICRSLCRRFQVAASGLGVSPDKAKELSQLCGVSTTVAIDPTINCD
ncbi:hypothetical protein J1N35_002444 [Gossypium stocksii]|uniref:Bifunctional inhibitor/plant lipid transfer protein/seed storage helical domain-containing protein n=1 Tax=Gossypium stocksii TaxID=47602 RepID=A0A9D3WLA8_9ROSI|nr:hypothetical protein J1N35_002444 [Gossypium stocksii]